MSAATTASGPAPPPEPDEARVQALARQILDDAAPSWRERIVAAVDLDDRLLRAATARPRFKTGLFRFVDAFPASAGPQDVLVHLQEYLAVDDAPRAVRSTLRAAGRIPFGPRLTAAAAERAIRRIASRFIGGTDEVAAAARAGDLWTAGFATTVDLLGEKTLTIADADAYARRLSRMLDALLLAAREWPDRPALDHDPFGPLPRVNISVKASALAPLLAPATRAVGVAQAMERLRPLLDTARAAGATIHVDTEHDEVKDATFALLREIGCAYPDGPPLGCVVQAYRRDALDDLHTLADWSAATLRTPLQVRLVKGAYWDAETIKARANGWEPPVWPEKDETDAAFEVAARHLVARAGAVRPAFASHNARSLAAALAAAEVAGLGEGAVEVQVLHGMAEPLHRAVRDRGIRTRVYVPVGELVTGMAYLVRRLLENTANESFVRRTYTERREVDELVRPPRPAPSRPGPATTAVAPFAGEPPAELRRDAVRDRLVAAVDRVERTLGFHAPLLVDGRVVPTAGRLLSVDPAEPTHVVCTAASACAAQAVAAVDAVAHASETWARVGWEARAAVLRRAADLMRSRRDDLAALCVLEAGKPLAEADADVCEAIDFCEYYARGAVELMHGRRLLQPPGERNEYRYQPRGVAAVIAPWNFPLAIPTGMVAAALVTGNGVVCKPAEQTPGVAYRLVEILLEAGVPPGVLALVPGVGEDVGPALVEHPAVGVIAFTGSKAVGLEIVRRAAVAAPGQRHVKRVVAEMGGKNAIVVDHDADLDEAVPAIVQSAFGYAGQKCSAAARVIAVGEVRDALVERLCGASALVPVGPPRDPATVVGPLIDEEAQQRVLGYRAIAAREGRVLMARDDVPATGWFVGPTIVAVDGAGARVATEEVFGPLLVVLDAPDFDAAIAMAGATDYALTAGCFSRTPSHLERAATELRAGNVYLNRGITGAVVGRQPFGGFGLSGVGSKAGGPDYLLQFVDPRVVTENTVRQGFAPE